MTDPRIGGDPAPEPDVDEAAEDELGAYVDEDGTFDLDRYQTEEAGEPFPFNWGGKKWMLPNIFDLPTDLLTKVSEDLDADSAKAALALAFGEEQWAALNAAKPLPIRATFVLLGRWLKGSGVDLGELLSSAGFSASTAGRSKRTSNGPTGSGSRGRSTAAKKTATRRARSSR